MHSLFGGDDPETFDTITQAVSKAIDKVWLDADHNKLRFAFSDGTGMKVWDDGQSCCEDRYMHTDDNLAYFTGAEFVGAAIHQAPDVPDENGTHEVQFLFVTTSKGVFTVETHNVHNGYYSGFLVRATAGEVPAGEAAASRAGGAR